MKRNARALLMSTLCLVSSCLAIFAGPTRAETLQTWVGAREADLVSAWGAPDLTLKLDDGTHVDTWIKHVPGVDYVGLTPVAATHECRQSFTISAAGTIAKWSYAGCSEYP